MKGIFGLFSVIRKKLLLMITTPFYDNMMLLFVIGNTITLSLNGLVDTETELFTNMNSVFSIIFTIDVSCKIIAFGF